MLSRAIVEVSAPMLAVTVPTFFVLTLFNSGARPLSERVEIVLQIQGQTLGLAYAMWLVSLVVVTALLRNRRPSERARTHAWTLFGSLAINPIVILVIVRQQQIELGEYVALMAVSLGALVFGAGFLVTFFVARHLERQSAVRRGLVTSGPADAR